MRKRKTKLQLAGNKSLHGFGGTTKVETVRAGDQMTTRGRGRKVQRDVR
jgi:hypothetical protein